MAGQTGLEPLVEQQISVVTNDGRVACFRILDLCFYFEILKKTYIYIPYIYLYYIPTEGLRSSVQCNFLLIWLKKNGRRAIQVVMSPKSSTA